MEKNKPNLLVRLLNKLKNFFKNNKIVKRVATLVISGALSTTIMFGCAPKEPTPKPNPNNPTSKYSTILENVLEDEYYNGLIDAAKEDDELYRSAKFDPHPYAFLKSKGQNVDKIKSGDLKCRTVSYVKEDEPNNLYMMTYVENEASDPYYTEYMLKYSLTEQEMKDYAFLHKDGANYYIQAVFMNDEISESKKATILGETKMNVEAHETLLDSIKTENHITEYYKNKRMDLLLKSFDINKQEFNIIVYPRLSNNTEMLSQGKAFEYPLISGSKKLDIKNNVFYGPTIYREYRLDSTKPINVTEITYFHSQDTILGNIYTQDLEMTV